MNLLSELRASSVPRPEPLARAVARRVEGRLAMIAWGVLYYVFFANYLLLGAGYGLFLIGVHVVGKPIPLWYVAACVVPMLAAIWLAFWPFRWWRRRRVAPRIELGRTGQLVDGEVAAWRQRGKAMFVVVWFEHAGHEYALQSPAGPGITPSAAPVGTRVPVLFAPRILSALYFGPDGRGAGARVQQKPA